MPRRKFTIPDEVILIYHDPDNKQNSIVLRYFEGDIPNWVADVDIPMRDIEMIESRSAGKAFKKILEDVPPGPPIPPGPP